MEAKILCPILSSVLPGEHPAEVIRVVLSDVMLTIGVHRASARLLQLEPLFALYTVAVARVKTFVAARKSLNHTAFLGHSFFQSKEKILMLLTLLYDV